MYKVDDGACIVKCNCILLYDFELDFFNVGGLVVILITPPPKTLTNL